MHLFLFPPSKSDFLTTLLKLPLFLVSDQTCSLRLQRNSTLAIAKGCPSAQTRLTHAGLCLLNHHQQALGALQA